MATSAAIVAATATGNGGFASVADSGFNRARIELEDDSQVPTDTNRDMYDAFEERMLPKVQEEYTDLDYIDYRKIILERWRCSNNNNASSCFFTTPPNKNNNDNNNNNNRRSSHFKPSDDFDEDEEAPLPQPVTSIEEEASPSSSSSDDGDAFLTAEDITMGESNSTAV